MEKKCEKPFARFFAACALLSLLVRFFRSPTLTESLAQAKFNLPTSASVGCCTKLKHYNWHLRSVFNHIASLSRYLAIPSINYFFQAHAIMKLGPIFVRKSDEMQIVRIFCN